MASGKQNLVLWLTLKRSAVFDAILSAVSLAPILDKPRMTREDRQELRRRLSVLARVAADNASYRMISGGRRRKNA